MIESIKLTLWWNQIKCCWGRLGSFELPPCFILSFRSWVKKQTNKHAYTHRNLAFWQCRSVFFYSFSLKIRPLCSICPSSLSLCNCVTVPKSVGVLFTTEKSLICAVTLSVSVFAHSAGCLQPFRWFGITTVWPDLMSTSHSESVKPLLWAETVSALHVRPQIMSSTLPLLWKYLDYPPRGGKNVVVAANIQAADNFWSSTRLNGCIIQASCPTSLSLSYCHCPALYALHPNSFSLSLSPF